MVCRFRTPLKEAPVWNVLITSICKESESETALLHSPERGRKGEGGGCRGWSWRIREERGGKCWEKGTGAGARETFPSYTKKW